MAKIISLKTRQVLANLPTVKTPRQYQAFKVLDGRYQGLGVIAYSADHAQAIVSYVDILKERAKASKAS
jgi:hypothetical protein